MSIGSRVKELRMDLGLSQQAFGGKIYVTDGTMYRIEKENKVTNQTIAILCEKYGVNEKWLLTGEGEKFNKDEVKYNWTQQQKDLFYSLQKNSQKQLETIDHIIDCMEKGLPIE